MFGNTPKTGATEEFLHQPVSPYGYAKSASVGIVKLYRNMYDIYAVNGYLFNHESSLRSDSFFSGRLVTLARNIKSKKTTFANLGELGNIRDFGLAREYIIPMHKMLQLTSPEDFVIASGLGVSLYELAESIFSRFELNFNDYYIKSEENIRKYDIYMSIGNPIKAKEKLDWHSKSSLNDVVDELCKKKRRR